MKPTVGSLEHHTEPTFPFLLSEKRWESSSDASISQVWNGNLFMEDAIVKNIANTWMFAASHTGETIHENLIFLFRQWKAQINFHAYDAVLLNFCFSWVVTKPDDSQPSGMQQDYRRRSGGDRRKFETSPCVGSQLVPSNFGHGTWMHCVRPLQTRRTSLRQVKQHFCINLIDT